MKPNFALSLSVDGIRLLHRAAGGWRRVGDVPVSAPDLNAALAALRARAQALSDGPLRTKLIVPNEQIRYLTVETGAVGTPARMDAAYAALDGATPYPVSELEFDICEDGAQTHIAAVARETLEEAEAFAKLHRLEPISFVSIPGDANFMGEPFFGVTEHSETLLDDGDMVEADGVAVVVVGDAEIPEAQDAGEDGTEDAAEDRAADDGAAENQGRPNEANAEPVVPAEDAPAAVEQGGTEEAPRVEDVVAALSTAQSPEAEDGLPRPGDAPAPDMPGDAPRGAPTDTPSGGKNPGFSSRRKAPALGPATRDAAAPAPGARAADAAPALKAEAAASLSRGATPADAAEPPKPAGFLSRRLKRTSDPRHAPSPPAAPSGDIAADSAQTPLRADPAQGLDAAGAARADEARRMTVFGARPPAGADAVGGKPRFLGLILTAVLLVFLAGIAAWASVFLDGGVRRSEARDPAPVASVPPEALPAPQAVPDPPAQSAEPEIAALDTGLSAEDAAVLDALQDARPAPGEAAPDTAERTLADAEARYAVTGIWPLAPMVPDAAPQIGMDDVYIASIDPLSPAQDVVILPARASLDTDTPLSPRASPAPAGTQFARDAQGRVIATEDGVLTPEGHMLFAGRPPAEPPRYPDKSSDTPSVAAEAAAAQSRLAAFRPQARPGDLVERTERANLGGLTRSELGEIRPQLRPDTGKEEEEAAAEAPDAPPSQFAAAASLRPDARPRNFARIVARAARTPQAETRTAAVAPRTVTPSIPSSASVAREATIRNAINLNRVNLIGVYGTPSARRALVRLSNGRYRKVKVGDRIDGGRVSAIGESELRYRKGNRNLVLKMPRS